MQSRLVPGVLYLNTSSDVRAHDHKVVSDEWIIEGRSVYRGARDPSYTHANVYWLYNEELECVGCTEHDKTDHSRYFALWFHESVFGTLLQEPGWIVGESLFLHFPTHVADMFVNEGWTTPQAIQEKCLYSAQRIITPRMLTDGLPIVYSCDKCGTTSLTKQACSTKEKLLDIPDMEKIWFVDEDLLLHQPPENSIVFSLLTPQPLVVPSSPVPQEVRGQEQGQEQLVPPDTPQVLPPEVLPPPPHHEQPLHHPSPPPQSHP